MTIEQCYQALGGNYAEMCSRLPNAGLIGKFAGKFLNDPSFDTLCEQMQAGNRAEAFRAAHTLKGVCANLSFSRLQASASALTEALRLAADTIPETAAPLVEDVRRDYVRKVAAIRDYLADV